MKKKKTTIDKDYMKVLIEHNKALMEENKRLREEIRMKDLKDSADKFLEEQRRYIPYYPTYPTYPNTTPGYPGNYPWNPIWCNAMGNSDGSTSSTV